ncbi:Fc.00g085540.m01.CDS01 [Cosmosporella sp. VM-42]
MPADFDQQSYWHGRFTTETSFEWLLPSAVFMALIEPHLAKLDPEASILQIGFGTSDLQNHLRKRGFRNVTNVDYEPLAIDRGRDLEMKEFGDVRMKYEVKDATHLDLPKKFNLVLDKSTVDAVSCGGEEPLRCMANGVRKHLADGAVWISLSYSASRFEIDGLPFDVEVVSKVLTSKLKETDPDVFHWCYLLRPKTDIVGTGSAPRGEDS